MTVISKIGIRAYRSIVKASLDLGEITVIIGESDSGKCLGLGTPVLMSDGTTMSVEDVVAGDQLMGPGGSARTVTALSFGEGPLFRIEPKDRAWEPWVCNENHILTLAHYETGDLIDVELPRWLEVSDDYRDRYGAVRMCPGGNEYSSFRVTPLGPGEYFGFSLDGDGRFLLGDLTVTHNSNVVRAIRDWAFNAAATSFTTTGHQMTRVAVVMGEHKILWEKEVRGHGGGVSRYVIANGRTNEKVSFKRIGLTVPVEVAELTGIRPVVVDDVSVRIHFSEQAEPWFLLAPTAWTPAKVSKVIGRISGVDALILANRDLVNKRTTLNREAKFARGEAIALQTELNGYGYLDPALEKMARARVCMEQIDKTRTTLGQASTLIRDAAEARRALAVIQAEHDALAAVVERADRGYLDDVRRLQDALASLGTINDLERRQANALRSADGSRELLSDAIDALEVIAAKGDLLCPLCDGPAHDDCRTALAEQAEIARRVAL